MRTFIIRRLCPASPNVELPHQLVVDAHDLYKSLGKYGLNSETTRIRIPLDDPLYQMVLVHEQKYQKYFDNYLYQIENEFTESERDNAEYLVLWVGNLVYEAWSNMVNFCCEKHCYALGYQVHEQYRLEEKSLGNKHLGNVVSAGYVVSCSLKKELEKHNLTNLRFIPCYKEKRNEIVGYRLNEEKLLPPLEYFDDSKILLKCETSGVPVYTSEIRGQIEIKRDVANEMSDFNATHEMITQNGLRLYLISQRMYQLLIPHVKRNFKCEPIKITD
jgi:hypothetical protein